MGFRDIPVDEIDLNFIAALRDSWCIVAARDLQRSDGCTADGGHTNMLTAAWAQVGHVWQRPVCTAYVRPSRFTREFIDASGRFAVSFVEGHADDLVYLGRHSGRDGDKLAQTGLHLEVVDGVPAIAEARLVLACRTIYRQPVDFDCILDDTVHANHYDGRETSIQYIGEIERVLAK